MSSDLLDVVHESARKGTLLSSCEPEVKELMRQIDVLLSSKQDATEGQVRTLKIQLQQRERELSSLRVSVQERNTQIERLKEQVKHGEHQLKIQSSDHETQLLRLRTELNRLNKSYDKLKSRRGEPLNKEKLVELNRLQEEIAGLHAQCESQQSQITHLSQQLGLSRTQNTNIQERNTALQEEISICRNELSNYQSTISNNDKRLQDNLTVLESQLKHCHDGLKSRERKIMVIRNERDELRKQHKVLKDELEKIRNTLSTQCTNNKELEVKLADLELCLTKTKSELENCAAEKSQLLQQLTMSHELTQNKDKLIESLELQYEHKINSQVNVLNSQMKELQDKLYDLQDKEKILKEENRRLRERVQSKTKQSTSSQLNDSQLQNYHIQLQLLDKEQLVNSLQERVSHLEDQLSEATSLQSSCSVQEDMTTSFNISSARGTSVSPVERSLSGAAINGSPVQLLETFQTGINSLSTPPSLTNNTDSILDTFKTTLDSIMTDHFNKMDQSLKNVL